ncbi:FlxA-like family protein [Pandoraea sp. ISTKB]|uniref:FlxA-like family protein n=1 Tax=Pandoraea sp. ISTKB TaxID=1586708 RepID=UPI0008466BCA|nr:FlxA-like family protein [Pandoraea sp. ISTKB]ODP31717.1 hypothetical protein A9762_25805 [Pandoraea sp. ISTKB]
MTIIIPTKSSATSGMLDIWQSHIQQQQADKAQAAQAGTKPAGAANSTNTASQASAPQAAGATGSANATGTTNTSNPNGISEAPASDGVNQLGDKTLVDLRSVNQSAKDQGKAQAAPDAGAGGNDIASQTIKKLKEMLAKVMAQLDAVRNNDRLPPEEKLQQVNALSSQAMSIQAQILALMSPTGNHVNTTA